jgi:hypothetical protein
VKILGSVGPPPFCELARAPGGAGTPCPHAPVRAARCVVRCRGACLARACVGAAGSPGVVPASSDLARCYPSAGRASKLSLDLIRIITRLIGLFFRL